jgi:hypothetical protein
MSWNYRILERDGGFSVIEAYYDAERGLYAYAETGIGGFESVQDIVIDLSMMIADAMRHPALTVHDLPDKAIT